MIKTLPVLIAFLGIPLAALLNGCGGADFTRIEIRSKGDLGNLCASDSVPMKFRLYALDSEGRDRVQDELEPSLIPVWTSDNEGIASVDAEGVVVMQALGVATISLEMDTPSGKLADTAVVSACDCLEPVTDPTRVLEALITAPPVGSPTARMRVRCPAPDATSGSTGCESYSGTVCWHEAIPAANTSGLGTWQFYHCSDGRIERHEESPEWSLIHTDSFERQGPGIQDDSGAPTLPGCSEVSELEPVDLRGGAPIDYYRCKCN